MKYWRIGTRPRARNDDWWSPMCTGSFVAVGFPVGPDLVTLLSKPDLLKTRICRTYPDSDPNYIATTLRQFVFAISRGDIVLAADGTRVLGIGEVVGDYEYVDRGDGAPPDRRRVKWLDVGD